MEKEKITFKGKPIGECSRDELEEMIVRLIEQRNKYRDEVQMIEKMAEVQDKAASWARYRKDQSR